MQPQVHKGRLVFIGTGLQLAGQIGALSLSYLKQADWVFSLVPDGFTEQWIVDLNPNHASLQPFYAQGNEIKSRRDTYTQMVDAILEKVRQGLKVVVALYGHPGVFACVSHNAIAQAKLEGIDAKMLPGISAEACLWADLSIDPGRSGHQSYEATQFLLYNHVPNPKTHLLLWQIALAGEPTLTAFSTTKSRLQVLVEHLSQWYPLSHEVIIYEAANLPVQSPRIDRIQLQDLPDARLEMISTLLIPPAKTLSLNLAMCERLGFTEAELG
ncbi:SAM-dependent methyltransferase [Shewanella maritima]|uniref:SAM-dependent methyltransferase n=1 Tax=Shewanella maritima TaxID=2520507 RepID=UPI003736B8C6